jgi:hypothetical protein
MVSPWLNVDCENRVVFDLGMKNSSRILALLVCGLSACSNDSQTPQSETQQAATAVPRIIGTWKENAGTTCEFTTNGLAITTYTNGDKAAQRFALSEGNVLDVKNMNGDPELQFTVTFASDNEMVWQPTNGSESNLVTGVYAIVLTRITN